MMVWDQEKNVKFIVLVYMMEGVDDWRVLVELQRLH
jgi:hypothetical protein